MDITENIQYKNKINQYIENGFLVEKQFLDPVLLQDILSQMQLIFWTQARKLDLVTDKTVTTEDVMIALFNHDFTIFKNCGKQVQHLIDVWRLCVNNKMIDYLMNVCGITFPNICTRPVVMFNNAKLAKEDVYHTVPFHQDAQSMKGSRNAVVCWIPLLDVLENLGPLNVVPGSHLGELVADEIDDYGFGYVSEDKFNKEDVISLPCQLGDVVFFNSYLIHGSGVNTSWNRTRWSIQFRYNDMFDLQFIEEGYVNPYLYRPMKREELNGT